VAATPEGERGRLSLGYLQGGLMTYEEIAGTLRLAGTWSSQHGEATPKVDKMICRLRETAIQFLKEDRDEEARAIAILIEGVFRKLED